MEKPQDPTPARADAASECGDGRAAGQDVGSGTHPAGEAPMRPKPPVLPKEIGGTNGPEPTRYGDWEHKGRCTDF